MKILFVGQTAPGQTSRMRMEALSELGHDVASVDSEAPLRGAGWLAQRLQRDLAFGPAVDRLNRLVLDAAHARPPDLLWAEKQELLHPDTLDALRARGVRLVHFTPDPYFTLGWKRTRLSRACESRWDAVLHCKRYEHAAWQRACRLAIYVPLGFHPSVHRPLGPRDEAERRRFAGEVSFVGGWEPRREALLRAVAEAGPRVAIWGYAWDHLVDGRRTLRRALRLRRLAGREPFSLGRDAVLAPCVRGGEVLADDYARALGGSPIGLGFLRRICPDQHTTRTFEIPACGSLLLADRTDEHRAFFEEGREAEFFDSEEELVDKARRYLADPAALRRVAEAGTRRCHASGYSYRERLAAALREMGLP